MTRTRLLLIVFTAVLVLDQLTKWYVDATFRLHESVTVLENFFHFTYVRNKGAAFGILAESAFRIPFFIVVTLVAVVAVLWYYYHLPTDQHRMRLSLALILGGAIGNLIDRVRFGEVIDFLDVHWYQYHWPAFNVADSAISVGVALLLWETWRMERQAKRPARPS